MNSQEQNTQSTSQLKTFAETTANTQFPKKEQAIVLNTINDIPQLEYIKALGKITSTKKISFASRISNNRFCVYFTDKCTVDELIQNFSCITINEHQIPFRRLVNPAKRFIISNAHPIIPHDVIIEYLISCGIRTLSQITFLKAGFQDELAHISSFRRQVYIHPDDIANVPGSIVIRFDNTDFRIFINDDTLTCYTCKQTGHTSNSCKNNPKNTHVNNNSRQTTEFEEHLISNGPHDTSLTETDIYTSPNNGDVLNLIKPLQPNKQIVIPNEPIKRPPPSPSNSSSSAATTHHIEQQVNENFVQPKTLREKILDSNKKHGNSLEPAKKQKKNSSLENIHSKLNEGLKPVEGLFSNNIEIPLSFSQYIYIMENFTNKSINIHTLCDEVSVDVLTLQKITEQVRPLISDKATKTKITKLLNLLFQSLPLQ